MFLQKSNLSTAGVAKPKTAVRVGVWTAAICVGVLVSMQPVKVNAAEAIANAGIEATTAEVHAKNVAEESKSVVVEGNMSEEEISSVYGDKVDKRIVEALESVKDEDGNRVYSDNFIDGLVANICGEGKTGQVQFTFSREHQYGFYLPSGGDIIQTRADIDYLMAWTTSDEETEEGLDKKGSCGVSQIQWSYGRRIKWLNILKDVIGDRDTVTKDDLLLADTKMFIRELDPSGKFWENVQSYLPENPTSADYAEAICRGYVKPAYMEQRVEERRGRAENYENNREDYTNSIRAAYNYEKTMERD